MDALGTEDQMDYPSGLNVTPIVDMQSLSEHPSFQGGKYMADYTKARSK